jgi:hypothetical protein
MGNLRRTTLAILSATTLAVSMVTLTATGAAAYGSAGQWQIGLSFNCNNPSLCASQGGFWGWAEFDNDNTADAQLTGCQHLVGGGPAGAIHFSANVTSWAIEPGSAGPLTFFVLSETDTFVGRFGTFVVTIPSENMDTGIPAVAGHFSSRTLFGATAPPGTNFEIQVAKIPNR